MQMLRQRAGRKGRFLLDERGCTKGTHKYLAGRHGDIGAKRGKLYEVSGPFGWFTA